MRAALVRIVRPVLVVLAATLVLAAPVAAREPVDPNTLNPPPPPEFNPSCQRLGGGIVCDLAFSDPPLFDEPSAIICDGTELLFSQTRSVVGKRIYDADGNLLRRHFREELDGHLHESVDGPGHRLGDARDEQPRPIDPGRPSEWHLERCRQRALVRARRRHGPGRRRSTGVRPDGDPRVPWSASLRRLLRAR